MDENIGLEANLQPHSIRTLILYFCWFYMLYLVMQLPPGGALPPSPSSKNRNQNPPYRPLRAKPALSNAAVFVLTCQPQWTKIEGLATL